MKNTWRHIITGSLKSLVSILKYPTGLILLGFICSGLAADSATLETGGIKGKVVEQKSNLPLAYVSIILVGTNMGTVTDTDGYFYLPSITPGRYNLEISLIGYETYRLSDIIIDSNTILDIKTILLQEGTIALSDVTVSPGSFSVLAKVPASKQTLAEKDIKNMSFAEDITRAVSRLPGISSNDFSSKFTVRGGESDEVLMTLDGMELYEPFHQRDFSGGLFSIVDIETIGGIDLLTGGFSAEYGNRQSGVFNMKTKQIRADEKKTSIGVSVMSLRLYSQGTFKDNKGSYLFSARKGILDQMFKIVGETENIPTFYDLMGKVEYQLNSHHTLSLHALHAGDKTAVRDISEEAHDIHDTSYENSYGWLTLKSFYNPNLYSRSLLYGGNITHDRNGDTDKYEPSDKLTFQLSDNRKYNFAGFKQDWNWDVSDRLNLKSGYDIRQLNADYDYTFTVDDIRVTADGNVEEYTDAVSIQKSPSGQQISAYISGRFVILPDLFMESGFRYDNISYTNDKLFSPRVSLAYALSKDTFLRAAWGKYYQSQFINNLDVNHGFDSFNSAELSDHYVLGLEHLCDNGISLRIEGYHKEISNLGKTYQNLRDPWEVFPESRNDLVELDIAGASASGLEFFIKYDQGEKISWWFSYALAKAEEDVKSISFEGLLTEQTGVLPRINDQRHTIYGDLNYRPNEKWHINLSWQYYTGWPMTKYEYDFEVLPNDSLHFYPRHTEFRGDQYPAYHRMDIRVNRNIPMKHGTITAYVHLINLYNRENLRKFDLDVRDNNENLMPNGQGGYNYLRDDKTWLGLTPVIGLSWEF